MHPHLVNPWNDQIVDGFNFSNVDHYLVTRPLPNSTKLPTELNQQQNDMLDALMAESNWRGWRRLVWLSGPHQECLDIAQVIARRFAPGVTWISDHPPRGSTHLGTYQAQKLLGKEISTLIFDSHNRFDPNAFAAACGAVKAGGIALLMTPDPEQWQQQPDLDAARIAVHPLTPEQVGNRFIRRLIQQLHMDQRVVHWSTSKPWQFDPEPITNQPAAALKPKGVTPDQQLAIDAVTAVVVGHRRRPALLISDRGRGKSAALGIAAGQLLSERCKRILVTGPRSSAAQNLFNHALPMLEKSNKVDQLQFIAPDKLISHPVRCDLLLVDEAAGLPLPMLQQLLKTHSRIAFATTVHGYEGSGRGFALRFGDLLDKQTPGWKKITLQQPIRFAVNDPLEKALFHCLMLDASTDERPCPDNIDPAQLKVTRINRDDLIHDELTLRNLFGLLVLAHYRTRPLDLRQLLDGPNIRVWTLTHEERIVATALVSREGDLDKKLARKIFAGERRPRGHLLPQTLAGHLGLKESATLEGERIMRIVVHPAWQGRGIGQQLVHHIQQRASQEGLDWCGSSFGATSRLIRFWGQVGMQPVYVGSRREASSGAHSVSMIAGLNSKGKQMAARATQVFSKKFPYWLAETLRELESPVIAAIYRLSAQRDSSPMVSSAAEEHTEGGSRKLSFDRDWRAFSSRRRSYEEALPSLIKYFLKALASGHATEVLDPAELQILIMKLLQKRSWQTVQKTTELMGRDQIISAARAACAKLSARP